MDREQMAAHGYEKGSAMDMAGGELNYYAKVEARADEQRSRKLVQVFHHAERFKATTKYGCDHHMTPLAQAKAAVRKQLGLSGGVATIKGWREDRSDVSLTPVEGKEAHEFKLSELMEMTINEDIITTVRFWK